MEEQVVVSKPLASMSPIPQAPLASLVRTVPCNFLKEVKEEVERGIFTLLVG